jgi:hypothetical protein
MKKSHLENQLTETEVIDDILCNMCGKSCSLCTSDPQRMDNFGGIVEETIYGGYFSLGEGLIDGVQYKFSICEPCLVRLFDQFKIEPVIQGLESEQENGQWQDISNLTKHREYVLTRLVCEVMES